MKEREAPALIELLPIQVRAAGKFAGGATLSPMVDKPPAGLETPGFLCQPI